jgi:hypothetical protein
MKTLLMSKPKNWLNGAILNYMENWELNAEVLAISWATSQ